MSYILDALKKSEQKRPPGPVPDLFTVQGPLPPVKRTSPPAVTALVAAALAGLIALGGWGWYRTQDSPAERGREQRASQRREPPPAAPQRVPSPPPAASVSPRRAAPASPRFARPAGPSVASTGGSIASAPQAAPPPTVPPTSAAIAQPAAAPQAAPVPVAAQEPQPPGQGAAPAVDAAAGAATPDVAPRASEPGGTPAEMPPADGRVVDIGELPPAVKAGFGKLAISGHVWSDDPALRMLSVQDRIVREGGEAVPGVRLVEITETGAVFSTHGWRFRLGGY